MNKNAIHNNRSLLTLIIALTVLGVFALLWLFVNVYLPYVNTDRQLDNQISYIEAHGSVSQQENDAWGTPILATIEDRDEVFVYAVLSAGPDKKYNTNDDRKRIKTDWNKSRILGRFAAEKGKELIKGIFDGLLPKTNKADE